MTLVFDLLVTASCVAMLVQHVWALRGHFTSERMEAGALAISGMVGIAAAVNLLLTWWFEQPLAPQIAGLALVGASAALFWAAIRASRAARLRFAFDDHKPATLVREGPYRLVRHPFYSSYMLFWSGWALATWSWWSLPSLVLLCALYGVAAGKEERLFVQTEMADAYRDYRKQAGMFWPRIRAGFGQR